VATCLPPCAQILEAIAWLRSQPDGRVTANAAELARQWGWAGCGQVAG
jgi:hypothetical protein